MKYTVEFDVNEFEFWSGAKPWVEEFRKRDMMGELEEAIEDCFCGEPPSDTDINDLVWFDEGIHDMIEAHDEAEKEETEDEGGGEDGE